MRKGNILRIIGEDGKLYECIDIDTIVKVKAVPFVEFNIINNQGHEDAYSAAMYVNYSKRSYCFKTITGMQLMNAIENEPHVLTVKETNEIARREIFI